MSFRLLRLSACRVFVAAAVAVCVHGLSLKVLAAESGSGAPTPPPVDSELSRRVLEALSRNAETAKPAATPAPSTPATQPSAPAAQPAPAPATAAKPVPPAPSVLPVPMPAPAVTQSSPTSTPATAAAPSPTAPTPAPTTVTTPSAAPLTHLPVTGSSTTAPTNNNPPPVVVRVPEPVPAPAHVPAAPATVSRTTTGPTAVTSGSYTIRPGDTFSSIASEKYGDEKKWTAIAQANPLVDPAKLIVGQVIRLPNLKAFEAQRSQPFEQLRQGVTQTTAAPAAPGGEVTVQKGDTLSHIAEKMYGKQTLWPVIYRANRDVLDTPDAVRPGMRLKIPPKP